MPFAASLILRTTVALLIALMFMGMLGAWVDLLIRLWHGQARIPSPQPRAHVPWKEGSVVLAALGVLTVPVLVAQGYLALYGPSIALSEPQKHARAELVRGLDLRLIPTVASIESLPKEGKNLVVVARANETLYFRIFDEAGKRVADTSNAKLTSKVGAVKELRAQLTTLWTPHELSKGESQRVLDSVLSLVDYPRGQPFSFTALMLISSIANALLLITLPLLLRATSRAGLGDLGLTTVEFSSHVRFGVMAFLLFSPVVYAINGLMVLASRAAGVEPLKHPLEQMVRGEFSLKTAFLAMISAVVLAPLVEELFFRGVFQGWLSKRFGRRVRGEAEGLPDGSESPTSWPSLEIEEDGVGSRPRTLWPILLTSAFFALVHAEQWPAPVAIFVLSLGLGFVYQASGSLVSSIVMHALFNLLGTLILFNALLNPIVPDSKKTAAKAEVKLQPTEKIRSLAQVVGFG